MQLHSPPDALSLANMKPKEVPATEPNNLHDRFALTSSTQFIMYGNAHFALSLAWAYWFESQCITVCLWGRRDTPRLSNTLLPTSPPRERTAFAFVSYGSLNTVEKLHPFTWSSFPSCLGSCSALTHLFQCSASHFSMSCLQSWARYHRSCMHVPRASCMH